ncbi:hypothetical protein JYQ78_18700, partial [Anaerobutyricum hallii]|uniref:hypothetical protein n=1 Tax=Anaerobutyricum hallii TaxID=39488 RepID=UPI001ADD86A9
IFSSGEILSIKNAPFQINSFIFLTVYLKGSIPITLDFVTLCFLQLSKIKRYKEALLLIA